MKSKKIVKLCVLLFLISVLCMASVISANAMDPSKVGYLNDNSQETGYIEVHNAAGSELVVTFMGKSVGDYRINGNTAICSYSAGDGLAGYEGITTKYIFGNNDILAKVMYYFVPQRTDTSPSGRDNNLPTELRGKSYAWLYTQLGYSYSSNSYFSTNYINTYADVVTAALFFQSGVNGAQAKNETNQYIVTHCLVDYIQNGRYTAQSSNRTAENAATMLSNFFVNYATSVPSLPDTVRVFVVNPYTSKNTQTLLSIEAYKGYFQINKTSSVPSITDGNSSYSLNGATYSWYKTRSAAQDAAKKVALGYAVPKGFDYIGYTRVGTITDRRTLYLDNAIPTTSTTIYDIGTYYLVETDAPRGYLLSDEVIELKITGENYTSTNRARITIKEPPMLGSLSIAKISSNPSITDNNPLYSLSGAEYTVYKDSSLSQVYAVITTRADGTARLENIPLGTYYVRESKAPKGYMLDNNTYQIDVTDSQPNATVTSTEPLMYVAAPTLISKKDADSSEPLPGAKFVVEYYDKEFNSQTYSYNFTPVRRWLFKTDNSGFINLDTAHLATSYTDSRGNTVSFTNDPFYYSESNSSIAVLPRGTLKITEVEAPVKYASDGSRYKYKLDDTPTFQSVVVNSNETIEYETVTLHNEIEGALSRTIQGEKTWDDSNNANGNRPSRILVRLFKNVNGTEEKYRTAFADSDSNWKYQFPDCPLTETINGVAYPVTYRVEEANIQGYQPIYSGFNIKNTEEKTSFTVKKVWDDKNDQDGVRPSSVIVRLLSDNVDTGKYAVLSDDNNWTYTFDNLPVYKNTKIVDYTVSEDPIDGEETYTTSISSVTGTEATGYDCTITNKHEPAVTSVIVKKIWKDTDNLERVRPNSIKVILKGYVNNSLVYETENVTLTSFGNSTDDENVWSYTYEGLDKYRDGKLIRYVVSEVTLVPGYNLDENGEPQAVSAACEEQEDGSFVATLENTHTLQRRSLNVYKVWDDDDNRDGLRPTAVSVYLMTVDENGDKHRYTDENGNEVIGVIQESNDWFYQFTNIPIYGSDRKEISYSIEEVVPSGYTVSYSGDSGNGYTITNAHHEQTSVTVNKVWDDNNDQDSIRPDSVVINLLADGEEIDEIELSEENSWTHTFTDLPVNENGSKISYTVIENSLTVPTGFSGYAVRYSALQGTAQTGYSYTVTNTHTPEVRSVSVNKVWSDSNNRDGIRPDHVEVLLSVSSPANTGIAAKRAILSEDNSWSYTFNNLPKYYNGTEIQYIADETDVVIEQSNNGYTKRISGNMAQGFTITNTHATERIKLVIDKVWDDYNDSAGMRPSTATFEVTGDQGQVSTVTLSASNNWHYEFSYNRYYNGELQEPEVKEIALPEGYVGRKVVTVSHTNGSRSTTYQYTWTNSFEPDPTSIHVRKIWNDSYDHFGQRPEGIIVQLFVRDVGTTGSGSPRGRLSLSDENDWQGTFGGSFPRYINGVEQEYFVKEYSAHFIDEYDEYGELTGNTILEIDANQSAFNRHYIQKIEGNAIDGFTITNTHENYRDASIPFRKIWIDDDDRDHIRPNSLDIVLKGYIGSEEGSDFENAIEVSRRYATVSTSNDWQYTFSNLPALCSEAQASVLVDPADFDLDDPSEYRQYIEALTSAREIWYKVEELNVPDGYEQILDDNEDWDYERTNNSVYTMDTNMSVMSFNSLTEGGYWHLSFGLVNEHIPANTSLKVIKRWDDANNQDGVRPASISFNLLANGVVVQTVTLSSSNELSTDPNTWSYTFTDLPINDNGDAITYTVTEGTVTTPGGFDNYTLQSVASEGNVDDGWVYTFTNVYEPQTTQLTVSKRWQDSSNAFGQRPNSLLIVLKADGVDYRSYTLTQNDGTTSSSMIWSHTFDNLPKYNNGVEIQYTVEERMDSKTAYFYKNTSVRTTTDSTGYKTVTLINKVRTATITIEKKDESGHLLPGVDFELFFSDGTPLMLTQYAGKYRYSPSSLSSYQNRVSSINGAIVITDLPVDATIIMREVTTPGTYFPHNNDIVIDVKKTIQDDALTDDSSGVFTLPAITVNNYKTVMPATGGFGNYSFYILAGMFLIGALFIYFKKRKDVDL